MRIYLFLFNGLFRSTIRDLAHLLLMYIYFQYWTLFQRCLLSHLQEGKGNPKIYQRKP